MSSPETPHEPNDGMSEGFLRQAEDFARQEPMRAVGTAFVVGLILTLLPLGGIIAGLVRLLLCLARPGLMILGAMKLYEQVNERQKF